MPWETGAPGFRTDWETRDSGRPVAHVHPCGGREATSLTDPAIYSALLGASLEGVSSEFRTVTKWPQDLVCGANFWCNRHCRTSPVVLDVFGGQVWPKIGRRPAQKSDLRLGNEPLSLSKLSLSAEFLALCSAIGRVSNRAPTIRASNPRPRCPHGGTTITWVPRPRCR
jgi:hypothetical protein